MRSLGSLLKPIRFILIIVIFTAMLVISLEVTQFDPVKLVVSAPKAGRILKAFMVPDLIKTSSETSTVDINFPVPCGSAAEAAENPQGARIELDKTCGNVGEKVVVSGKDLEKNSQVVIWWIFPDGRKLSAGKFTTNDAGEFTREIDIRPLVATKDGVPAKIEAEVSMKTQHIEPSDTLRDVVDSIMVTIFMALLATTIGTLFAVPLGFLAASNITKHGRFGTAVYYVVRSILNLIRAYEPLVMATIFALIVGYGTPFAGILALVFVTTASLGKMFSESVESIDPGPIEAIRAAGGNWVQVIKFAVIPQIIPDFLSFTIYHWDINVRVSTIIGFVGGGGIGFYLSQRINTFEYGKAGTAIYMIVLVVWILDFISARIRKETV